MEMGRSSIAAGRGMTGALQRTQMSQILLRINNTERTLHEIIFLIYEKNTLSQDLLKCTFMMFLHIRLHTTQYSVYIFV